MITVRGLTKRFGEVPAVADLSFEVEPGETFAIVGPNGAGKTTTLRMLLGLVSPDRGVIGIGPDRLPPRDPRARARLGYVPQKVAFPPGRTTAEALGFFAALRGLGAKEVRAALERVGLEGLAARRASELSGGYTQRLSLAQALLGEPELLVLDEPTASLDPEATWEFRGLLERLQREGKTVLLCSHLLAEVERIADRVLILLDGAAAAILRLDELRARQMESGRLVIEPEGEPEDAARALAASGLRAEARPGRRLAIEDARAHGSRALELLRASGLGIRSFEVERPSLEEIFLEVVHERRRTGGGASLLGRSSPLSASPEAARPLERVTATEAP